MWMIGRAGSLDEGKKVISTTLQNGAALEKFQNMMIGQGVASQIAASLCSTNADYYSILRRAHYQTELETQGHGNTHRHRLTNANAHTHTHTPLWLLNALHR